MKKKKARVIWVLCDKESLEPVGSIEESCYWDRIDAVQNKCHGDVVVKFVKAV